MKKIISSVLVCILLVGTLLTLASCGTVLSGEYEGTGFASGKTYEFSFTDVTIVYEIGGFEKRIEGKYKITTNDDDEQVLVITIEGDDEEADEYKGEHSFSKGTEDGVDYIKIDGFRYNKKK